MRRTCSTLLFSLTRNILNNLKGTSPPVERKDDVRAKIMTSSLRSALFVPCSNIKALNKIKSLNADVFILDLEDSVPDSMKDIARENLIRFVKDGMSDEAIEKDAIMRENSKGIQHSSCHSLLGKRLIVRVNSFTSSPYGPSDMDAVCVLGELIEGVGIPKVSTADASLLSSVVHPTHNLWAFFETPKSIIDASEICASGRYQVAAMGLNDYSMELHLPLRYHMSSVGNNDGEKKGDQEEVALFHRRLPFLHAMSTVITAARAYGMQPLDGVYNNPTDNKGCEIECREAFSLGFSGKTLIHPSQIDIIHKVYAPSAAEISWAKKVINAIKESDGGVAVVDGKMVEDLHAKMAMRIMGNSLE